MENAIRQACFDKKSAEIGKKKMLPAVHAGKVAPRDFRFSHRRFGRLGCGRAESETDHEDSGRGRFQSAHAGKSWVRPISRVIPIK